MQTKASREAFEKLPLAVEGLQRVSSSLVNALHDITPACSPIYASVGQHTLCR